MDIKHKTKHHSKGRSIVLERQERISIEEQGNVFIKNTQTQVRELFRHKQWHSQSTPRGRDQVPTVEPTSSLSDTKILRTRLQVDALNNKIENEIDRLKKFRDYFVDKETNKSRRAKEENKLDFGKAPSPSTMTWRQSLSANRGTALSQLTDDSSIQSDRIRKYAPSSPRFRSIGMRQPQHENVDSSGRRGKRLTTNKTSNKQQEHSRHVSRTKERRFAGGCTFGHNPQQPGTVYQADYGSSAPYFSLYSGQCHCHPAQAQQQPPLQFCRCCEMSSPNTGYQYPAYPQQQQQQSTPQASVRNPSPAFCCCNHSPHSRRASDLNTEDYCRNWYSELFAERKPSRTRDRTRHSSVGSSSKNRRSTEKEKEGRKTSPVRPKSKSKSKGESIAKCTMNQRIEKKLRESGIADAESLAQYKVQSHEKIMKVTLRKEDQAKTKKEPKECPQPPEKMQVPVTETTVPCDDRTDEEKQQIYHEYMEMYKAEHERSANKDIQQQCLEPEISPTYTKLSPETIKTLEIKQFKRTSNCYCQPAPSRRQSQSSKREQRPDNGYVEQPLPANKCIDSSGGKQSKPFSVQECFAEEEAPLAPQPTTPTNYLQDQCGINDDKDSGGRRDQRFSQLPDDSTGAITSVCHSSARRVISIKRPEKEGSPLVKCETEQTEKKCVHYISRASGPDYIDLEAGNAFPPQSLPPYSSSTQATQTVSMIAEMQPPPPLSPTYSPPRSPPANAHVYQNQQATRQDQACSCDEQQVPPTRQSSQAYSYQSSPSREQKSQWPRISYDLGNTRTNFYCPQEVSNTSNTQDWQTERRRSVQQSRNRIQLSADPSYSSQLVSQEYESFPSCELDQPPPARNLQEFCDQQLPDEPPIRGSPCYAQAIPSTVQTGQRRRLSTPPAVPLYGDQTQAIISQLEQKQKLAAQALRSSSQMLRECEVQNPPMNRYSSASASHQPNESSSLTKKSAYGTSTECGFSYEKRKDPAQTIEKNRTYRRQMEHNIRTPDDVQSHCQFYEPTPSASEDYKSFRDNDYMSYESNTDACAPALRQRQTCGSPIYRDAQAPLVDPSYAAPNGKCNEAYAALPHCASGTPRSQHQLKTNTDSATTYYEEAKSSPCMNISQQPDMDDNLAEVEDLQPPCGPCPVSPSSKPPRSTICDKRIRTVKFQDESCTHESKKAVECCRSFIDWERAHKDRQMMGDDVQDAGQTDYTDEDECTETYRSSSSLNTDLTCHEDDYNTCAEPTAIRQQKYDQLPPFDACPCMFNTYLHFAAMCTMKDRDGHFSDADGE
ncbi:uncharacterized protein LOC115623183 [Scaptodrosophila lebanonensis]|uniref:Uncharacterized protein LOC115623183 n=1 Tax=Drosophila lebanonensis TaxID=7225 RepID=A0A6J2TDR6_DROLE|nr:uncharacterized protein LOC115623183 [Scaptodrosophila lebanonensis]XP_030373264.1 uncharacterized protein LOC115623183 [Scaptodrosophila lebanonensis]